MSKRKKTIPDLRPEFDRIELDQITMLIKNIQEVFSHAYGAAADIEEWNSVRLRDEFEDLYTPLEFNRLFASEFGRGVIVGSWVERFIISKGAEGEESEN